MSKIFDIDAVWFQEVAPRDFYNEEALDGIINHIRKYFLRNDFLWRNI